MRVLVLGGTNFIGPPVVRRLVDLGHEVAVFHRGQTQAELPGGVGITVFLARALPLASVPLADVGITDERTQHLLDEEPELGDRWLAYVVLTSVSVSEDMTRGPSPSYKSIRQWPVDRTTRSR